MDPDTINRVRTSSFSRLYNPSYLISGKEGSAYIYTRAKYSISLNYINECLDKVRKLANTCENL